MQGRGKSVRVGGAGGGASQRRNCGAYTAFALQMRLPPQNEAPRSLRDLRDLRGGRVRYNSVTLNAVIWSLATACESSAFIGVRCHAASLLTACVLMGLLMLPKCFLCLSPVLKPCFHKTPIPDLALTSFFSIAEQQKKHTA